mmetsp:Transcript_22991/g.35515  ORF Transcript_22991/g.35515 Transcript_22991/m.35515 type:complete len:162 (+) Transcript_22991:813-1298(+)
MQFLEKQRLEQEKIRDIKAHKSKNAISNLDRGSQEAGAEIEIEMSNSDLRQSIELHEDRLRKIMDADLAHMAIASGSKKKGANDSGLIVHEEEEEERKHHESDGNDGDSIDDMVSPRPVDTTESRLKSDPITRKTTGITQALDAYYGITPAPDKHGQKVLR